MLRISAANGAMLCLSALVLATPLIAQSGEEQASPVSPAISSPVSSSVSKVRIVRISQIKGAVNLDRDNGRGFEPAIANLPVIEKSRLQTGMGVAEVEFEDNSTMRLAPDSIVDFPTLERLPGGTTVSSVHLVRGTAYLSLMKTPGNEFNLLFGDRSLRVTPATHIRLQLEDQDAKLAVLDGTLNLDSAAGSMSIARKKTATFALDDASEPTVAKEIAPDALDAWDHNATEYHARTAVLSAFGNSPNQYGLADMSYYGSFINAGSCGSMWRPYFASAGWEPYSNGAWAWYQNAGYSWVSPYPWGWTPYHSGSWSYCEGTGWGWMPGGGWMGLNNVAAVANPGKRGNLPIAPKTPPRKGAVTLTAVNLRPMVHSEVSASSAFVFRKDSAGLGVPREGLGKLEKFSQHTIARGSASTPVYMEGPSASRQRSSNSGIGVSTMHRGSPQPSSSQASSPGVGSNIGGARSSGPSSSPSSPSHSAPSGGSHH